MANYQKCKVRVYSKNSVLDETEFIDKVMALSYTNGAFEIKIHHGRQWKFAEFGFTSKRFIKGFLKAFSLAEHDIWILNADEGGGSDHLYYFNDAAKLIYKKALYAFDTIVLFGTSERLKNILESLDSYLYYFMDDEFEEGIKLKLSGFYTVGNFDYGPEEEDAIRVQLLDNAFTIRLAMTLGDPINIIFHQTSDDFLKGVYEHTWLKKNTILNKIEFHNKNQIIRRITNYEEQNYWLNWSGDGFHNCINFEFLLYQQTQLKIK